MTQVVPQPLKNDQVFAIAQRLLNHRGFGLRNNTNDENDLRLIERATDLLAKVANGDNVDREEWTQLKKESLRFVGSDVADTVSRIASALRTPDIALSGLRDAAEKTIEVASKTAKRRIIDQVQSEIQLIL